MFSERVEEVGSVVCSEEHDAEVIYIDSEVGGQGCVCPKDGGV